ncbi:MAG: YjjG family noncanonical pyrimidine nucleotidase [Muribaculaceae bacterium]|nr:YjjG family noncanonical pyrimidine nucleotidase [Muribaculaceae bacterium]
MNGNKDMLAGISTVFIDIDDTLWWFTENSKVAFRHTYDKFGISDIEPCYERFHDIYLEENNRLWELYHHGKIEKDFLVSERFRYVLDAVGYKGDCMALAHSLNEEYLSHLATLPLAVPGALGLLQRLTRRGLQVNVLSNGFKGVQQQKLSSAGLLPYITHVVLSDDCGITKPQRGIFDYALEVTGAQAETSVMIGDNPEADIQGAHDAGWKTIYFNLKGKPAIPGTADYEVASLDDIL